MKTFFSVLIAALAVLALTGAVSVVDVPLRLETSYAKRAAGVRAFYFIFRDPKGRVLAIPEDEFPRLRQNAIDEGFDKVGLDDLYYLPTPQQAVGNTAKATITIEHQTPLSFYIGDGHFFITWDDDHPGSVPTLNGEPIVTYLADRPPMPPAAPQPATAIP